jgi:PKD repeat protein
METIVVTGVPNPAQCVAGFTMYPDASDVTLINSSTGSNLSYLWDFGDGATSTQQFPSHTYATSGNYYLCLTVDDGAGCVDMYCDSIGENGVVFKGTGFTINVIAPPVATGINNEVVSSSDVRIYPDPTSTQLTIDTQLKIDNLTVTDITGKTIASISLKSNVIDVSNLSDGIYFIKIEGEGKTFVQKFIKN